MLQQAENRGKIEGILLETDLKYGSFTKEGRTVETIGGTITVQVDKEINGVPASFQIPVNLYSQKYKKDGTSLNPAYTSIESAMREFKSVASCGKDEADRVRITGARIRMNEFYSQDGRFVSYPRIEASFVNKATGEFKPSCEFTIMFAISNIKAVVDDQGIELDPKKLEVTAIVPQYGGKVDIMKFYATNENVIAAIEQYWEVDKTFKANLRLNFVSKTEKIIEQIGFGEPQERLKTTTVNEMTIIAGSEAPFEGDAAYDMDELVQALRERKARLDQMKVDATKKSSKKAPAQTSSLASAGDDLGF